jgi:hypothetical protein
MMPMTVRLNDDEQDLIRKKAVEINRLLIQKGKQPIRDSSVVHIIIEQAIDLLEVTASGDVRIAK